MPLDPVIARKLADAAALGLPPLDTLSVAEARARAAFEARPAGAAVAEVSQLTIPVSGGTIEARVYRPVTTAEAQPVLVYFHGGGWVICSLDTHDNVCRNLAAEAGIVVISVDYRMAPEFRFPVATDDCLAAVRYVAAEAAALGIDPARILVGGDSAGGNLAAVTALRCRDEDGPRLAGQLLIYPVTDHYSGGHGSYAAFAEGYGLTDKGMIWFWDHYAPTADLYLHPHAAPLRADDLGRLPPAYLMTAELDVLRDEGERYAERLAAAGVEVTFRRFDGLNHGVAGDYGAVPAAAPFFAHMVAWLRAQTAP